MSDVGKVLCWHCNNALVGKNGSWKARPLIFALVETEPGRTVKVHKVCEQNAKASMSYLTAQPSSAGQMDAQLADQLGED